MTCSHVSSGNPRLLLLQARPRPCSCSPDTPLNTRSQGASKGWLKHVETRLQADAPEFVPRVESMADSEFAGFLTPAASLSDFGGQQLPSQAQLARRGSDAAFVTLAESLGGCRGGFSTA